MQEYLLASVACGRTWNIFADSRSRTAELYCTRCVACQCLVMVRRCLLADAELVKNSPGAVQLLQLYSIIGHTWFLLQVVFDPRIRSFQKDRKAIFSTVQCAAMSEQLQSSEPCVLHCSVLFTKKLSAILTHFACAR